MSSGLPSLAREHYGDDPEALRLLETSADSALPDDEREAATQKLVELDRERILRARVKRGEGINPDDWEASDSIKAEDVNAKPTLRVLRPCPPLLLDEGRARGLRPLAGAA